MSRAPARSAAASVTQIEKKGRINRRVRIVLVRLDDERPRHVLPKFLHDGRARRRPRQARPRRDRRLLASAQHRAARRDRVPARAYPRRGLFRHRRDRGHATAACRTCCRSPTLLARGDDGARPRRRHALRRLRRARPVRCGARLVDAARLRRGGRAHPRRRPDEMDRRGAADSRPARRIRSRATFTPRLDETFVASLDEVRAALASGSAQVVDARPADRFRGEAPEPRPGLRSGHMPGSLNLPFSEVVEHGRLKPPEALQAIFAAHKVDLVEADHHDLRLGRQRRDPGARRRGGRRHGRGPLRRLLGGMGRARRLSGRDRGGVSTGSRGRRRRRAAGIVRSEMRAPKSGAQDFRSRLTAIGEAPESARAGGIP